MTVNNFMKGHRFRFPPRAARSVWCEFASRVLHIDTIRSLLSVRSILLKKRANANSRVFPSTPQNFFRVRNPPIWQQFWVKYTNHRRRACQRLRLIHASRRLSYRRFWAYWISTLLARRQIDRLRDRIDLAREAVLDYVNSMLRDPIGDLEELDDLCGMPTRPIPEFRHADAGITLLGNAMLRDRELPDPLTEGDIRVAVGDMGVL
jgi:hypothetical protein